MNLIICLYKQICINGNNKLENIITDIRNNLRNIAEKFALVKDFNSAKKYIYYKNDNQNYSQ